LPCLTVSLAASLLQKTKLIIRFCTFNLTYKSSTLPLAFFLSCSPAFLASSSFLPAVALAFLTASAKLKIESELLI